MKVEVITDTEKEFEREYRRYLVIKIDGKRVFSAYDGEPEDANLSRDFNDCYVIEEMLQMAYEAGKRGDTFEIVEKKGETDD